MILEQKIVDYLQQQSKGVIKLSLTHAKYIIDLVQGNGIVNTAYVKLYRKNHQDNTWHNIRNIRTTDEKIKAQIVIALEKAPNMDFYKYECFNSENLFEGAIFTFDQFLFD